MMYLVRENWARARTWREAPLVIRNYYWHHLSSAPKLELSLQGKWFSKYFCTSGSPMKYLGLIEGLWSSKEGVIIHPTIPLFDKGAEFFLVMMMEMRRCNHLLVTTPLDWGATYLMGFMNTMMPHNLYYLIASYEMCNYSTYTHTIDRAYMIRWPFCMIFCQRFTYCTRW